MRRQSQCAVIGLLLGCPALADLPYTSFDVDTGEAVSQTVLHAALTEQSAQTGTDDLVVFSQHEDGRRALVVYALVPAAGEWLPVHSADVAEDVIFADTITLGGRDRLLLYRRGGVDWLAPATWRRRPLSLAGALYNVPPANVPHVDIGRDLDGDGLDDLAVADFDGYLLRLQRGDGTLGPPLKLHTDATTVAAFDSVTYRPRAIYRLDYDGDGTTDLAFWRKGRFDVYRGIADGFDTTALSFTTPVAIQADDLTSFEYRFGDREPRTLLHDVRDYNGDGIGDIATTTLTIEGLFDQSTRYDFHFGRIQDGVTVFRAEPDTTIASDGIQGPFETMDFDNNGGIDFGMASIEIGIGRIIAALITGTVRFDVEFYLLEAGVYPETPNVTRPVRIRFSLTSGTVLSGNWLEIGEVTGDGIADLLVRRDETLIDVYAGTADADVFASEPDAIRVDLPSHRVSPDEVDVVDLNGDGRDDMLIRFPSRPDEDEPNRVGVVLSR